MIWIMLLEVLRVDEWLRLRSILRSILWSVIVGRVGLFWK